MKKLRFHVDDKKGKSKCVKLHIGKPNKFCPRLKVHETLMQQVTEVKYLGDIISHDGKNRLNIKSRISEGIGSITQIFNILDNVNFGPHVFETAILLRESVIISSDKWGHDKC